MLSLLTFQIFVASRTRCCVSACVRDFGGKWAASGRSSDFLLDIYVSMLCSVSVLMDWIVDCDGVYGGFACGCMCVCAQL